MNAKAEAVVNYQFPEKLGYLLELNKYRYKIAYGGRDSGKSWNVARALLLLGASQPLRIGCFREVQKSIKDSVHQLLSDQIKALDLEQDYEILQNEIRGKRVATSFAFSGLSTQTRDSIKSYEGLDIVWVEEAQGTAKRSWEILIPTIRRGANLGANPEIWATFNPDMDTDDTYVRFVLNPPPGSKVVHINFNDNPWASKALDAERKHLKETDPEAYAHVYLGVCRPAVEGAIYYKEVSQLRSSGRFGNVPYDPMLKVHIVADLGFNDYMSLILFQRLHSEIRIIRYLEDRQRYIPSYSQELRDLKLNYGRLYLPHDGMAKHLTGSSAQEQFTKLGWDVSIVPSLDVESGIRKAREMFPRVAIDAKNAGELLNRLGRYRRRVNADGQASTPLHDDASHGADGYRYLSIIADQASNDGHQRHTRRIQVDTRGIV